MDDTVRRCLRDYSRKPWLDDLRLKLADALAEAGQPERGLLLVRHGPPELAEEIALLYNDGIHRRAMQRHLRRWRAWLQDAFGDQEDSLLCEPVDTSADAGHQCE